MARSDLVVPGAQVEGPGRLGQFGEFPTPLPMVVGPSRPAPSVLAHLAVAAPPIDDRAFVAELGGCLKLLRQIAGATPSLPVVAPGTGTTGMESLVNSLLRPGEPVVVLSTGMWGNRWRDICLRHRLPTQTLMAGFGHTPDLHVLDQVLTKRPHQAVLVTQVDSSSGVRVPVDEVAAVAARHGVLMLVDGVAALGAEHVSQSDWGIDAYLAATPKAIAAPAGLALPILGPRALDILANRDWTPGNYSLDLLPWVPVMAAADQGEFGYFQTPAGNLVMALAEALRLVVGEGPAERVARHRRLRDQLTTGLVDLGIRLAVADESARSHGITVGWVPYGWTGREFVDAVARAGVIVQTGTHPTAAARTFRIGHLGNVSETDIERTLAAIESVLAGADRGRTHA